MSFSFEKVVPLGITEYLQNRKSLQKLAGLKNGGKGSYQIISKSKATAKKATVPNLVNFSKLPSTERPLFFCQ